MESNYKDNEKIYLNIIYLLIKQEQKILIFEQKYRVHIEVTVCCEMIWNPTSRGQGERLLEFQAGPQPGLLNQPLGVGFSPALFP